MSSRFALKSLLPLLLLAAAGAVAALLAGPTLDVDAARRSRGGGTEATLPMAQAQYSNKSDTSQWATASGTVQGVSYSFRYPAGWGADLTYCAKGAEVGRSSGHLPPGCASTDFLAGQKALDAGSIADGTPLVVDGKNALRFIDRKPSNVLVSQLYTVMVYDDNGQALFGFTTQVGYETDAATLGAITEALDGIVGTLRVGASR
jgi:hypothetical protein